MKKGEEPKRYNLRQKDKRTLYQRSYEHGTAQNLHRPGVDAATHIRLVIKFHKQFQDKYFLKIKNSNKIFNGATS